MWILTEKKFRMMINSRLSAKSCGKFRISGNTAKNARNAAALKQ
jgi:hypothetical protein